MVYRRENLEIVNVKTTNELITLFQNELHTFRFRNFLIGRINRDYFLTIITSGEEFQLTNALYLKQGDLTKLLAQEIPNKNSEALESYNHLYKINSNDLHFITGSLYLEDDCTTCLFGSEYRIKLEEKRVDTKRLEKYFYNDELSTYLGLYSEQQASDKIVAVEV
ncbi:hypothetical protein O0Q50_19220 [Priestia aryabhattai]|uniref:Uncharacterized protein n=1 Tax=Priestia aryabhattai TaxID=412384 RepID=A0AAX6NCS9_PRIAR|nr:hypothetical protein [Priestia aryabhattai]MDU9693305.1 hypothetical protein [Priestia aryabhattai]